MNWSFQLYSARNFLPWDGILKMLGKVGYKEVEGFGGVYDDPKAFRAELDKNGLAMPTTVTRWTPIGLGRSCDRVLKTPRNGIVSSSRG